VLTWLLRGYGPSGELQGWGIAPGFKVNQMLAIDQKNDQKPTVLKFLQVNEIET